MTIFERIVNKEIPSYLIYEDELVMSFLDISQASKGHTLVITKKPYENLFEVPDEELKHLFAITKKIATAIKIGFNPEGINLLNNNGAIAGQTVFHYHVHILPRYDNTSIETLFNTKHTITDEEYKKRADVIRQALL